MNGITPQLLDAVGRPIESVKRSTNIAPNLDPKFWYGASAEASSTVADVLSQPYTYHVWVHRCVSAISKNIAGLIRIFKEKQSGAVTETHAALSLLQRPNAIMTGYTFFRTIMAYLLLPTQRGSIESGGQLFLIPWDTARDDKVRLDKGEIPGELFPYPESYFEPWRGDTVKGRQQIRGWHFRIPQIPGSDIFFEHGEIIRIYDLNPYDILKGMSPFSPAAAAVEMDARADIYNSSIFANDGRLDGTVTSPTYIDTAELGKMKEEWFKQYTGSGRRRVAFLSGGLKYEQYALSSTELGYIDQEKWSRQKTLGAYGMNRIGVGDYEDINYATIREGRKLLWYDTYIPFDKLVLDSFNGQWIRFIDNDRYELVSDYTKVPALQADMQDRAKTGLILTQMGYPPSLASRIVELPLQQADIDKWPHLDKPITLLPAVLPTSTSTQAETMSIRKSTAESRQAYSERYITRSLDPGEKFFRKNLDAYFVKQRNGILDKIDGWSTKQKSIKTSRAAPDTGVGLWMFLPDAALENLELMGIYSAAAKNQARVEKETVEDELGRIIEWSVHDTRIQAWASVRSGYLAGINTTTFEVARDAIDATVKAGMDEGVTVPEMAKRIKAAVHDVYEVRLGRPVVPNGFFDLGGMSSSGTIARTEMGTIASMTRNDIFQQEGVEKIEWITSHDDRVRESHQVLDGEYVRYGDLFSNGLKYPRDPDAEDPGEVINCRCAFIARVEKDGE